MNPHSPYRVTIDGAEATVHTVQDASYVLLSSDKIMQVEVATTIPFRTVKVRPLSVGIAPVVEGNRIRFEVKAPAKLSIELDGSLRSPLFLLANPPETFRPSPDDVGVRYYAKRDEPYDAGEIVLGSGETLYIEEGARVYGRVSAYRADDVKVAGRGILDGSLWRLEGAKPYSERTQRIRFIECSRVSIEGITVVDGENWHIVPIACNEVRISDVNVITFEGTGDGIDVVGCKDVRIEGCFIRSNDDCIAVKGNDYFHPSGCADVERVRVERCVLWNAPWGNAIEIGYETRCEHIRDIVFEDIDIIHCEFEGWQSGGTFTIHNGDRATVSDVFYRRIRVEDSREKLVDIKIQHSVYSKDERRGLVINIRFEDIDVVDGPFPVSIIRGFDGDHLIENVAFERLTVHGEPILSANQARMVVELAKNVSFS
ncbi:glycosyl hydrolase family 28 protein [Cohnella sp. GCM10027633]|uniref:glycosyl hydrolase family 28 protein n=1 Tax=unclassified Cohnella TaxID=2636738 RepID=UPI00363585A8